MGELSLKDKFWDFLAHFFWRGFLWAEGWTDEQYQKLRDEDAYDTLRTAPIAEIKVDDEDRLWVRLDNYMPDKKGAIRLLYEPDTFNSQPPLL